MKKTLIFFIALISGGVSAKAAAPDLSDSTAIHCEKSTNFLGVDNSDSDVIALNIPSCGGKKKLCRILAECVYAKNSRVADSKGNLEVAYSEYLKTSKVAAGFEENSVYVGMDLGGPSMADYQYGIKTPIGCLVDRPAPCPSTSSSDLISCLKNNAVVRSEEKWAQPKSKANDKIEDTDAAE